MKYRHQSGHCYRVITEALIEATLEEVVVYCEVDHPGFWVRPKTEFYDCFEFLGDDTWTESFSPLRDVGEFHNKFGLSYIGKPRSLPDSMSQFRRKFLQEELDEYGLHMDNASNEVRSGKLFDNGEYVHALEGMLDALVDLTYVALGTAYLHGFDFAEAWKRVHAANMKKVRAEFPEDSKRGITLDVVKPKGWEPPSHTDLVEDHDFVSGYEAISREHFKEPK